MPFTPNTYTNPNLDWKYAEQLKRYLAEQERQRQLAILNLQQQQDIKTNAESQLGAEGAARQLEAYRLQQEHDKAMQGLKAQEAANLQAQTFTGQQDLQKYALGVTSENQQKALEAQMARQAAAEAAAKLQQTTGIASQEKLQQEAEAAAAAQAASGQQFQSSMLNQQAKIQQEAEARRQQALQGLLGQSITGAGGLLNQALPGGVGANLPGGVGGGTVVSDEDAARGTAFARAKDQAGLIGRSALSGLQSNMTARGLGQSSIYNNAVGQAINQGATQLGEVSRDQMTNSLQNARQRASEQYQGALTQRGQNIGLVQSALSNLMGGRAY